ncbi:josephin-like protein [Selaginella moellendorffii]|uniref:josephin-like protein n=1 Tax=Selaginella moellendorffii TaxID=88036 RepID=UPI000D1CD100|nr:josephin-like protein [Selaginella moellendorffii]|eukprot:XP_024543899.1 josephin-like protein [Selaginella moellendorffii]
MADDSAMAIYHERQRLQLCLLHALNNLLQGHDRFTRQILDAIADSLEEQHATPWSTRNLFLPSKQHRNPLTGNYDANVLMAALSSRGLEARWHDRRSAIADDDLSRPNLAGLIANTSSQRFLGLWRSRHWIALRRVHGSWYNLDSDLPMPVAMRGADEVRDFLNSLRDQGAELFFVFRKEEQGDE